jgi:2,3-bisphosphoglycerate-dependent phosphoglycerate mutase
MRRALRFTPAACCPGAAAARRRAADPVRWSSSSKELSKDNGSKSNTIKLVLMRHGQSQWNMEARFTGWADIGLTTEGEREAARAGAALRELGFEIDQCFTSMLKRSVRSAWIMMGEMGTHWVPVTPSWKLNERHYGALTGMSKPEATEKLGHDAVMRWRRSWAEPPPPIAADHPLFHALVDRRYAGAVGSHVVLPSTESLSDVSERVVGFWEAEIQPALRRGEQCLVVAHAHTLRALIKHLDRIGDDDIEELTIPTGTPLVYSLDRETLRPVRRRAMAGMRTSHVAIDEVPLTARPLDEQPCAVEQSPIVNTREIDEEALKRAAAKHETMANNGSTAAGGGKGATSIETKPYQKIKPCNTSWRVVSGPGIIEEAEVKAEHRRMGEEANFGGTMVFLSEAMLKVSGDGRTEGRTGGWMDGWTEERKNGRADGAGLLLHLEGLLYTNDNNKHTVPNACVILFPPAAFPRA